MIEVPVADKVLLTIKEASAVFNIGETRLRALCSLEAHGSVVKIGTKVLVNKKKLEQFFDNNRFFD